MKIVGKRKQGEATLQEIGEFLKLALKLFAGNTFIKKGIYRGRPISEIEKKKS